MSAHSDQRGRAAVLALWAATMGACSGGEGEVDARAVPKIRPTDGPSAVFDGYGQAEARFVDSPDGLVRVWYVESGAHAVSLTDEEPADGVPDFPQLVARTADEVATSLQSRGWRLPVADELVPSIDNDGGSAAFDIYLVDFARADGLFFAEGCLAGTPETCAGYIAIKNNFSRTGYASIAEAVDVLISHEYFHAVQAAYTADLPAWWSEGTATWHEEYFEPAQDDFERLANAYFEQSGRSLNGIPQGPGDLFGYGTAVFVQYLEQTLGEPVIREVFEALAESTDLEAAIIDAVDARRPFDEAFAEFAAWTLATGTRTVEGFGFESAEGLDELDLLELDGSADLNWDTEVRAWAHEPAEIDRPRDIRLEVRPLDGWSRPPVLVVVDPDAPGTFELLTVGQTADFDASDRPLVVALVNPDPRARTAGRLAIRAVVDAADCGESGCEEPETPVDPETGAQTDHESGCASTSRSACSWANLLLLLAALRRRPAASTVRTACRGG